MKCNQFTGEHVFTWVAENSTEKAMPYLICECGKWHFDGRASTEAARTKIKIEPPNYNPPFFRCFKCGYYHYLGDEHIDPPITTSDWYFLRKGKP